MDQDDIPKIFKDMRFYVQAINHPKREELILKLNSRGGIEVGQPNHPLCRATFVFASNVQPYKIKGKARPLETCLGDKTWTFHDLCTHFCRNQGDKEKRQGFVVDASWVDECIERGAMIQRERWSGKEIWVKKKDRLKIHPTLTHTSARIDSTPISSPATRQSTGTPALDVELQQDVTLDQVNTRYSSVPPENGPTLASDTIPDGPPGIFTSFTDQSATFHVFPHKGSAKLVASINYYGGQVVNTIELADYIIVDRASAHQVPPLKKTQCIINATWVDDSLEFTVARNFEQYIIIPGSTLPPASMEEKPRLASEGSSTTTSGNVPAPPSQSRPSTTGRKRAATLSAPEPVAKFKRTGNPKESRATILNTSRSPSKTNASLQEDSRLPSTPHQTIPPTVTHSLSGLFQIADKTDTPAQNAARKFYVAQVVEELDEWCERKFEGSRTAFLTRKRAEINPEFDRVKFFSYNKKAVLEGLAERGRDVSKGSELCGGIGRDGKAAAVEASASGTNRLVAKVFQSSTSPARAASVTATSKSKRNAIPMSIRSTSASGADTSSAASAAMPTAPSALDKYFRPSGEIRRLGPLDVAAKEERFKLLLAYMIDELDQWCLNDSRGSRTAFLAERDASSELKFDRNRLFLDNKEAILRILAERGRKVHKGTKIYGDPPKGPRTFVFNRRDGRETVASQSNTSITEDPRDTVAVPYQSSNRQADPASDTTRLAPITAGTLATSLSFAAPQRKRAHSMSAPFWNKNQKQANLARLVDEVQGWCQGSSRKARTTYLKDLTISKPGFDRVSLLKKNRDFVFQALAARNVDVSEGSRAHGIIVVGESTVRSAGGYHDDRGSNASYIRATTSGSHADTPAIAGSDQANTPRPASDTDAFASSSQTSVPPVESVLGISELSVGGLPVEPEASPYDVPLPFPMECWITPPNE